MGGHIAWILRLEDGTEYHMNRHTNEMPALIQSPAFLDGHPDGIDAALKPWLEMQRDWEANQESGAFENEFTPEYGPYPSGLRPIEYGLVLTDFKTRTFLSLQGYSHFNRYLDQRLLYGNTNGRTIDPLREAGRVDHFELLIEGEAARLLFEDAGHETSPFPSRDTWQVLVSGNADYAALVQLCDQIRRQPGSEPCLHSANAALDLAPFDFERFAETPSGYRALRDCILDLEFSLSDEDDDAWALRISELETLEEGGLL